MPIPIPPTDIEAATAVVADPQYFGLPRDIRETAWAVLHAARRARQTRGTA